MNIKDFHIGDIVLAKTDHFTTLEQIVSIESDCIQTKLIKWISKRHSTNEEGVVSWSFDETDYMQIKNLYKLTQLEKIKYL